MDARARWSFSYLTFTKTHVREVQGGVYAVRQVSVSVLGRPSRAPSSHRVPGSGEYRISLFNCSGCPERVSCFVMPENNESLLGTARKYEECSSSASGARPINLQNFWNTQRNPPRSDGSGCGLAFSLCAVCKMPPAGCGSYVSGA